MQIRHAEPAEANTIVAISRTSPWKKDDYVHRQVTQGNVLVSAVEGAVRGFAIWNSEFFSLPFVWLVVVEPAYRNRGIASRLFDTIEAQCRDRRLFSSTNRSQIVMQRFFERRGYRRSGEIDLDPGDAEIFYELTWTVSDLP